MGAEAETGVTVRQAKVTGDCWEAPDTRKGRGSANTSISTSSLQNREKVNSVVSRPPVCVICYSGPRDLIWLPAPCLGSNLRAAPRAYAVWSVGPAQPHRCFLVKWN